MINLFDIFYESMIELKARRDYERLPEGIKELFNETEFVELVKEKLEKDIK